METPKLTSGNNTTTLILFHVKKKNEARYFNQTKRKLKKNDLPQEKCGVSTTWWQILFWMSMSHLLRTCTYIIPIRHYWPRWWAVAPHSLGVSLRLSFRVLSILTLCWIFAIVSVVVVRRKEIRQGKTRLSHVGLTFVKVTVFCLSCVLMLYC